MSVPASAQVPHRTTCWELLQATAGKKKKKKRSEKIREAPRCVRIEQRNKKYGISK
jgi:hypothetical protein